MPNNTFPTNKAVYFISLSPPLCSQQAALPGQLPLRQLRDQHDRRRHRGQGLHPRLHHGLHQLPVIDHGSVGGFVSRGSRIGRRILVHQSSNKKECSKTCTECGNCCCWSSKGFGQGRFVASKGFSRDIIYFC